MSTLNFESRLFNRGYAFVYTCLQGIFLIGFLFVTIVLLLPANTITIPDAALPVIYVTIPLSVVGFPLVTVIKRGYRRLVKESELQVSGTNITYKKLTDKLWTVVGHVEEYHLYSSRRIDKVVVTKRFYVCHGEFEKTVINNGRTLSSDLVNVLKIPRAYESMERIVDHE